jgi:menaquinol-cytochrome c reductase iron-sulfur subunit
MGIVVGWPAVRAFLSPAFRPPPQPQWIKIGEVEQMELGVAARFDFAEMINDAWVESRVLRGVWVYTEDGERFTVYNARCTHLGCGYAFDKTRNLFQCPCHHGLFDLKTGRVLDGPPPRPLDTLETKVEDGLLYVAFRDFREGVPEKIPVS